ncbi:hypothetical protein D3C84_1014570 [compost metagenome]
MPPQMLQQVINETRLDAQFLATRLAHHGPALHQACQAFAFFDEGAEKTLMAGQAQGVIEGLECFLGLLLAVQGHGEQNMQL